MRLIQEHTLAFHDIIITCSTRATAAPYNNKRDLASHMENKHGMEQQSEQSHCSVPFMSVAAYCLCQVKGAFKKVKIHSKDVGQRSLR